MPNGDQGLDCDASCRAKLILDGDNISSLAGNLCKQIEAASVPLKNGRKIAQLFADCEDKLCEAQKLFVDGIGYSGPLPKMLQ